MSGAQVSVNVESLKCDGRHLKADLSNLSIKYKAQPGNSDLIIIDETRQLSNFDDLGASFFNYLGERSDRDRISLFYYQDDVNAIAFPSFVKCFLTHQVDGFSKNPSAFPVPFGFTVEGLAAAKRIAYSNRDKSRIIQNFNPTFNQLVRESIITAIDSINLNGLTFDERHLFSDEYTQQLSEAQYCLAVGGQYYWPRADYSYLKENMNEKYLAMDHFSDRRRRVGILRWDSFRFWESMAFGCLPIHLDFDLYGFSLPIVPKKWLHYIPINLANVDATFQYISRLHHTPELLEFMSTSARDWCSKHVHPATLFEYVLSKYDPSLNNQPII